MLSNKREVDTTRRVYYFSSALTYLLGMVSSNMALQWINYPTQVVGKAAKPIPVMILGVLVGHKSYPMKKYLFVLLIVVGVVMFMYKDQVKKTVADDSSMFGIGELLLLLSLTMDGLTGAVQERIKSESSPSAYAMMLNTNMCATLVANNDDTDDEVPLSILARALNNQLPIGNEELKQYSAIDDDLATCEEPTEENIVQNIIGNSHDSDDNNEDDLEENCTTPSVSEAIKAAEVLNVVNDPVKALCRDAIFKFIVFVSTFPEVIIFLIGLAFVGALGQMFIFFMVSEYGPLPCSVVTTTRKFFTVLMSVIIFGNALLPRQWLGAILVFAGLFLDMFYSKGKASAKRVAGK
ncbi:hypothetical protein SFRURICE_014066 [Spodoptera frugiperda]|nr:hypothetical protein SFRURICE_014066 [Spodoptera frugiperda]